MSTSYYLIKKSDKSLKEKYIKLISEATEELEQKYIDFFAEEEMDDIEDAVLSSISKMNQEIENAFICEEIHVCEATLKIVYFFQSEHFSTPAEFEKYFMANKDTYMLEDEYGQEYVSLQEILKKHDVKDVAL